MATNKITDQVYEQPEQKILKYTRPEGAIPINPSSLLFAKYSFWNFENRIDIRKYFVTRHENPKYPDINAKLQPGRKGICLSFAEALELVRGLRALLWAAKYCEDCEMTPSEEMIAAATSMTTPLDAFSVKPRFGLKRAATGSDATGGIYNDASTEFTHSFAIKESFVTCVANE